ncbi:hypothetical protein [Lacimicrobium sp. SS2-24]|uniref:hypothetical protein n=1 Tax=Lacimicrobium sp. SS2-24 TaxID=2005569 RepID=UPI00143AFADE|nr:hypothetical protein [Lacimicrobium sp. SS2-24]
MILLSLLFAAILVLLVYSLAQDKGKNTPYFRNKRELAKRPSALRKKPLRTGESLY